MVYVVFGVILLLIMAAIVAAVVLRPAKSKAADHRRRFALDDAGQPRIPLAPERADPPPVSIPDFLPPPEPAAPRANRLIDRALDSASPASIDEPAPDSPAIGGRIVDTPDGEIIITSPPFALRPQLFNRRLGRYYNGLTRRLPIWVVACPRMRLDALVTPTAPDGRDPDDWAQWRRRVRMRAIDFVLCDRRTWKPLAAIMIEPPPGGRFTRRSGSNGTTTALVLAGGQDRMIDELLAHVGLPLIRGTGDLSEDWPVIEPYVNEAILGTSAEPTDIESAIATSRRPDPDAAVNLLKLDGDEGWLLE